MWFHAQRAQKNLEWYLFDMKAEPLGTAYWNSRKVWLDRLTKGHNGMELLDCNAGNYVFTKDNK